MTQLTDPVEAATKVWDAVYICGDVQMDVEDGAIEVRLIQANAVRWAAELAADCATQSLFRSELLHLADEVERGDR